jgi:hypothetical protein
LASCFSTSDTPTLGLHTWIIWFDHEPDQRVDLTRFSLTPTDREFEFSVCITRRVRTKNCFQMVWVRPNVCPRCVSLLIGVPVCVSASHDFQFSPIRMLAASDLNLLCICFRIMLVDDPDLPDPVLMCLWFFWWSSAFYRSSAVLGHQIPVRWPRVYINFIIHLIICSVLRLLV